MRKSNVIVSTLIMAALAIGLVLFGYARGQGQHVAGLKTGLYMFIDILPLLIFAFMVAGMAQVIIPKEMIAKLVGEESGVKGIFIGSAAGALTPGGPFISFPIAAGLLRAGASVGPIVAFVTGWLILAVTRIPLEVGMIGWKFTIIRLASSFFIPPLAGIIAQSVFAGRFTGEW
ncbi:MAG: permease [Candidatus Nitrospinota bacterium M3_3B_026]